MRRKPLFLAFMIAAVATFQVMAQHTDGKTSIGVYGSVKKLVGGDVDQDIVSPLLGIKLGYTPYPAATITLNGGFGETTPMDWNKSGLSKYITKYPGTPFKTTLIPILADLKINYRPESTLNPYVTWGMGILIWDLKSDGNSVHGRKTHGLADFGGGVEWFLNETLGLDLSLHYQHILSQKLDMSGYGDVQSGIIETRLGVNFFFGGNRDTDGDGIPNRIDKCPKQAEDMDGYQDQDGCPDPDNDGDGILDVNDKAPNQAEDMDGYQDQDGVPDPDNDGDGILDVNDKAPNQAEDLDGYQDQDGVPDLDNDGDGIPDLNDTCPNQAETVNGFEDDDGCPDKKPEVVIIKETPIVLEGVTFKTGRAVLTSDAKVILDKVYQTLADYPEMSIEVRGHTDNVGKRLSNLKLSQRRADAVKAFLTGKGIAAARIQTKGFGSNEPIAPNTTAEGRLKNRRIEFIRIK